MGNCLVSQRSITKEKEKKPTRPVVAAQKNDLAVNPEVEISPKVATRSENLEVSILQQSQPCEDDLLNSEKENRVGLPVVVLNRTAS